MTAAENALITRRSYTCTFSPLSCSNRAKERPATPAPITTTRCAGVANAKAKTFKIKKKAVDIPGDISAVYGSPYGSHVVLSDAGTALRRCAQRHAVEEVPVADCLSFCYGRLRQDPKEPRLGRSCERDETTGVAAVCHPSSLFLPSDLMVLGGEDKRWLSGRRAESGARYKMLQYVTKRCNALTLGFWGFPLLFSAADYSVTCYEKIFYRGVKQRREKEVFQK